MIARFPHGRAWHRGDEPLGDGRAWPGEDAPPDTPLWRSWLPLWLGAWGVVVLVAVYGLPWIADKVLP